MSKISATILAGGKSKRFGLDKSMYIYKGKPLIEYVIDIVKTAIEDISIIADNGDRFEYLGFPVFPDLVHEIGPLGGIYTALSTSKTEKVFIFACDMPNLNKNLIEYMISISNNYDIIIPFLNSNYETLHAIYSHNCLKHIKKYIKEGKRKITGFFDKVNVRRMLNDEIEKYSDSSLIFKNINYIEDFD